MKEEINKNWKPLYIRVPPSYLEDINKYRENHSITLADLGRRSIYEYMHGSHHTSEELHNIRRQLSAIGNNLNQLSRHANTNGEIEDLEHLKAEMSAMRSELRRVLKKSWK